MKPEQMRYIYFYDSLLGRYALEETGEALTRLWVGDRVSLVPAGAEIKETPLIREAHNQLEAYFSGECCVFFLCLYFPGERNFRFVYGMNYKKFLTEKPLLMANWLVG